MKKLSLALLLGVLGAVLLGCPDKQDPKPDPSAASPASAKPAAAPAASSAAPKAGGGW